MSAEVNGVLDSLNSKFEQLVSLYEKTRVECDTMQQDCKELMERGREQEEKLTKLEEKNKSLLMTHAFAAANGSAEEAKEKISKIVREIDKCITLLTR
jgi:chromosome segregation ATPase